MFDSLREAFNNADKFWTLLVGIGTFICTLLTVLVGSLLTSYRLKVQLLHDSSEKAAERKQTLRREIYLKASEEIPTAITFLIRLHSINIADKDSIEPLNQFNAICSKLQLVTDTATGELIRDFQKSYYTLFFLFLKKAAVVTKRQSHIQELSEAIQAKVESLNYSTRELEEHEAADFPDTETIKYLNLEIRTIENELAILNDKLQSATSEYLLYLTQYFQDSMGELKKIGRPMARVLASMRKELGLDGESEKFETAIEQQWTDVAKLLDGHFQNLLKSED